MKKIVALLLALVMIVGMIPTVTFAANYEGTTIYFETDFEDGMKAGDTFTVTAKLANNTEGLGSVTLSLKWNENVKFDGFRSKNPNAPTKPLYTVALSGGNVVTNHTDGVIAATNTDGYWDDGILFVANFTILAGGDLGIGLKTDSGEDYKMTNWDGTKAVETTIDYRAISGLTAQGPVAEEPLHEDLAEMGITAITTNKGGIQKYLQLEDMAIDTYASMGYSSGNASHEAPHYQLKIPADATEVYVTFDTDKVTLQPFDFPDKTTGASGVFGNATVYDDYGLNDGGGMTAFYFLDEAHTTVVFPVAVPGTDMSGGLSEETYSLIASDSDEGYYAASVQWSSDVISDCPAIVFLSFEYAEEGAEEEEIYNITIDENIVGGTVTVLDENSVAINKAKESACIYLAYEANESYRFKHYLINGNVVTEAELGMNNGFYQMPAKNITVSAVFEEVAPEIEPNPITDIEISHPNLVTDDEGNMTMSMVTGASEQINVSTVLKNAEQDATQVVAWSSSDPKVASVENGKVTALQPGTTVITAKAVDASPVALLADGEDVLAQFTLTVSDPAAGYTVNMGEDKTVVANETVQIPVTVTHSDPSVTDYKSFEFTFQYDPALLTLKNESSAAEGKDITIVNKNDTITVRRYGNALKVGDAAITLEFTAKAVGNTNVKLITAKVGTSDDAKDENIPTAQIEDNLTEITVSGYTVNLPDEFEGKRVIVPGEDYTFTAKDLNYNYTITATIGNQTLTVTGSGTEADPYKITADQITGNIEITTEGEKTYVQYMKNYTAKLTEKNHYIYDLKVTVNNAKIEHTYDEATGIITIPGNLITGSVVIESGEKESEKHDVTFDGAYKSHAKYEGDSDVYNGESFSFTIETPAGLVIESYQVSYKMGDAEEYTTLEANNGTYTIENITADLTIKIEGTSDLKVKVNEYVKLNGKTVFLVTATQTLPTDKNLAYDSNVMYLKNFQVEGSATMEQMYSYLVVVNSGETLSVENATAMITIVEAQATTLEDTFDVNESNALDINDAQLVYDLYNNVYQEITTVGVKKFLRADVNGSRNIDVADAAAVVNAILEQNQ